MKFDNILLDATLLMSGAGVFVLANIELVVAAIVTLATFLVTAFLRRKQHASDMKKAEQEMRQAHELHVLAMKQAEEKHKQELLQDKERHETELEVLLSTGK